MRSGLTTDDRLPTLHHSEADFKRLHCMGLNVVRFYLNYHWFEDDARPCTYEQTGFD